MARAREMHAGVRAMPRRFGEEEVIRLREHESAAGPLGAGDAEALGRLMEGRLTVAPVRGDSEWRLQAGSWVGVASLPSGRRVVVEPKAAIGTLFAMIEEAYGEKDDPFRDEPFEYDSVEGLFEFMVRAFVQRAESIVVRGILRGYSTVTDDPPAVRGRLLIAETLRRNPVTRERHQCAYGRLSADVPENRILLCAASLLAAGTYRDTMLVPRLRRIVGALRDTTLDPAAAALFETLGYHRLNDHYRPALAIARMLLEHLAYAGRIGSAAFLAFLVDMNQLFEKYVGAVLRRGCSPHRITVREQWRQPLDFENTIELRPDVTLLRGDDTVLVVDAKYKLAADRADVYQMVAYCHGLGLRDCVLVHPAAERNHARLLSVRGAGDFRVRYLPISLDGDYAHMRAAGGRLAAALMEIVEGGV